MKIRFSMMTVILGVLAMLTCAAPVDVSGVWNGTITIPGSGKDHLTFDLKSKDDIVTGTIKGGPGGEKPNLITEGTVAGNEISFKVRVKTPDGMSDLNYVGKINGNQIKGTVDTPIGKMTFLVTKE